jgi:hypothetical protein
MRMKQIHDIPQVILHQFHCEVKIFVMVTKMFIIISDKYCIVCLYVSVQELEGRNDLLLYFDKNAEKTCYHEYEH